MSYRKFLTESKQSQESKYGEPDHEASYPSHDDNPYQRKYHSQKQASAMHKNCNEHILIFYLLDLNNYTVRMSMRIKELTSESSTMQSRRLQWFFLRILWLLGRFHKHCVRNLFTLYRYLKMCESQKLWISLWWC